MSAARMLNEQRPE